MGQNLAASDIGAGVYGPGPTGPAELKHGIVDESGSRAFLFRVWKEDPATAGSLAQRSERYFAGPGETIPQNTDVWFAVRIRASSWDVETRRIIWQWHEDSPVVGLSPHLSATVNGNRMRLIVLHNENATLTPGNTTQAVIYTDESWRPGDWYDFVIKARVDPRQTGAGYVKAWINGALVANYVGPVGYLYDNPADYAKVGIYHWNSETNQWRAGAPETIETRVAATVLLRDGPDIDESVVRRLIN